MQFEWYTCQECQYETASVGLMQEHRIVQHSPQSRIVELKAELEQLKNGDTVVVPSSREHAEAMLRVASFYLETCHGS